MTTSGSFIGWSSLKNRHEAFPKYIPPGHVNVHVQERVSPFDIKEYGTLNMAKAMSLLHLRKQCNTSFTYVYEKERKFSFLTYHRNFQVRTEFSTVPTVENRRAYFHARCLIRHGRAGEGYSILSQISLVTKVIYPNNFIPTLPYQLVVEPVYYQYRTPEKNFSKYIACKRTTPFLYKEVTEIYSQTPYEQGGGSQPHRANLSERLIRKNIAYASLSDTALVSQLRTGKLDGLIVSSGRDDGPSHRAFVRK